MTGARVIKAAPQYNESLRCEARNGVTENWNMASLLLCSNDKVAEVGSLIRPYIRSPHAIPSLSHGQCAALAKIRSQLSSSAGCGELFGAFGCYRCCRQFLEHPVDRSGHLVKIGNAERGHDRHKLVVRDMNRPVGILEHEQLRR